jgi:hypothetical protein
VGSTARKTTALSIFVHQIARNAPNYSGELDPQAFCDRATHAHDPSTPVVLKSACEKLPYLKLAMKNLPNI